MALLGFTKSSCGAKSGGVENLYIAKIDDVTSFTANTAPATDYTAVVMESSELFKKYEFEQDTCEFKHDETRENGVLQSAASIEFFLDKMSSTSRNSIQELADNSNCGLVAIVQDTNGIMWVVGYTEKHIKNRPLELVTNASTSGKALTDINGSTVTLGCTAAVLPHEFTGTVPLV